MDNNWILFCIWHVQLPFLWLSTHSYFHTYQTTPTECTCARLTLRIRISSIIMRVATRVFRWLLLCYYTHTQTSYVVVQNYDEYRIICTYSIRDTVIQIWRFQIRVIQIWRFQIRVIQIWRFQIRVRQIWRFQIRVIQIWRVQIRVRQIWRVQSLASQNALHSAIARGTCACTYLVI